MSFSFTLAGEIGNSKYGSFFLFSEVLSFFLGRSELIDEFKLSVPPSNSISGNTSSLLSIRRFGNGEHASSSSVSFTF